MLQLGVRTLAQSASLLRSMLFVVFAAAGFALGGAAISDQRSTRSAISANSSQGAGAGDADAPMSSALTFCHN